jgi:uncharacterized protein YjbJ (UPF0337 family)
MWESARRCVDDNAAGRDKKLIVATIRKENFMNWDQISGQWKQVKGKAKEKWGKLTDDEIDVIEGKRDQLVGKIQERYGVAKDQAEKDVDNWAKHF